MADILSEVEVGQEQKEEMRRAAALAAINARIRGRQDPSYLPEISLVPTPQELLCLDDPYLPSNRPGSVAHVSCSSAAHIEIHFRLLRHDGISPLGDAAKKFRRLGGISSLKKAKGGRLTLGGDSNLFTFRNVQCVSLEKSRGEGLFFKVAFDAPPALANKPKRDVEEYWKRSKRLGVGTLAVLWWEPDGTTAEPKLLVGVITHRDAKEMAQSTRPVVGIRLCDNKDFMPAVKAWLVDPQKSQGSCEVILVQPGSTQPGSAQTAGEDAKRIPAYLADGVRYNLCSLVNKERVALLPEADSEMYRDRLRSVDMTQSVEFPIDAVVAVSTLDTAQANALRASLTQEVAVVQGAPGTGKTFLGTVFIKTLLENTSNRCDITYICSVLFAPILGSV
eukprot:gene6216-2832_t